MDINGLINVQKMVSAYCKNYITNGAEHGIMSEDGGRGSGNFGHAGRPGLRGGSTAHFGGASTKNFADAVVSAKKTLDPKMAWRVTAHTQQELETEDSLKGAKLHITSGGSTVAVTRDGDIVSVCKNAGDSARGKDLIKLAVDNGGKKLDSYSGNDGFYKKMGFLPVSSCPWDDQWAPEDWIEANGFDPKDPQKPWTRIPDKNLAVPREDIVFYKYVGDLGMPYDEWAKENNHKVKRCPDYEAAQAERDGKM